MSLRESRMTAGAVIDDYLNGRRDFMHVDLGGVDLSYCELTGASFYGANLKGANLAHAILTHVQLKGADVKNADLSMARLNATDLIAADFSNADCRETDFTGASLFRSRMKHADLSSANFGAANLEDADLSSAKLCGARLFHTVLCDLDVSAFCDEPKLNHGGPSHVDYRTVVKSHHHPAFRQFISDCGVPGMFSEFMIDCARASTEPFLRRLMQSTFISYGGPDERFARRLYEALRNRGVITFFFPESATVGARISDEVFRAIQRHDRVLLVCSRRSLNRAGVVNEIHEAFDREAKDGGATYLLPITLDDYLFDGWRQKEPALAERVARRVVGDFRSALRSRLRFDKALSRLVDALKIKKP